MLMPSVLKPSDETIGGGEREGQKRNGCATTRPQKVEKGTDLIFELTFGDSLDRLMARC